jgi:hypothetical protein
VLVLAARTPPPTAQASGWPFEWSVFLEGVCITPRDSDSPPVVPFTGVSALAYATPAQIEAAFPPTWGGKSLVRVDVDLKNAGLVLAFSEVTGFLLLGRDRGLTAVPPEALTPWETTVRLETLLLSWDPMPGRYSRILGATWFGDGCWFNFEIREETDVTAWATVNFVALYAAAADTVRVWGDQVGIPDKSVTDTRRAVPVPVEPVTWGAIKASFR